MKLFQTLILGQMLAFMSAEGQTSRSLIAGLQNPNIEERIADAEALMADEARSPEADTALVSLLLRENILVRNAYLEGVGSSAKYGEDYSNYVAFLGDAVMRIADKNPQRTDVWPALLNSPYDPESRFAVWLGSHGDKSAPFLIAQATRGDLISRTDALLVLAQIVAYEQTSEKQARHLNADTVQVCDRLIRAGLNSLENIVRLQAVKALGIMGNRDDLEILARIATSDPVFSSGAGPKGDELYYPIRVAALRTVENLRLRLEAQQK